MKILIVDDERVQREILRDILGDAGYETVTAASGEEALGFLKEQNDIGIVLTDLKMPGIDGFGLLETALASFPDLQIIIMTAFGSIPGAVKAIKQGAYDYLAKPFRKDDLLLVIRRAEERLRLIKENKRLKEAVAERFVYGGMLGKSPAMRKIFRDIERVKDIDATCLIIGESGTGKELVAKAIHFQGKRKNGPFIALNCGAIPENLIESELFGYEKGAFTGAENNRPGSFELAQGGTIFLDEIGTMRPDLQTRLLRVLEEKKVRRLGSSREIILNVRVIAATNARLEEEIKAGRFRGDLYHRLNVFSIELPPLRERREDIPLLVSRFLTKFAEEYHKSIPRLTPSALEKLRSYDYPGNIRELENIIEKTMIISDGNIINADDLPIPETPSVRQKQEEDLSLFDREKRLIEEALKKHGGSIKKASQELKISYKTLQYRIKKYNIDKKRFSL